MSSRTVVLLYMYPLPKKITYEFSILFSLCGVFVCTRNECSTKSTGEAVLVYEFSYARRIWFAMPDGLQAIRYVHCVCAQAVLCIPMLYTNSFSLSLYMLMYYILHLLRVS